MTFETIAFGIIAGITATATMDVLAIVFGRIGLTAGAKGEWVGRWYIGISRGQFVHEDITTATGQAGEKQAALVGHYVIGIVLAVFYIAGAGWLSVSPDSFFAALGYGFATTVFPWFLVLPALGFGVFGLKGPPELKLFRSSLLNHLSYGFGLWWITKLLKKIILQG